MKLLYKQPEASARAVSLEGVGIYGCYLKFLSLQRDRKRITKKTHRHTGYEIHMITQGCQVYQVGDKEYVLKKGDYLVICPNAAHRVVAFEDETLKYSVTFQRHFGESGQSYSGKLTPRILDHLEFISDQAAQRRKISDILIGNCILEILISLLQLSDLQDETQQPEHRNSDVLAMAKQYIEDNIENAPEVSDVADYCGLSTKQLTRIFHEYAQTSPGTYMKERQLKRAETLLADTSLSLKQISEKLCFSSEYYFNAFFKRNAGMPPGEYRKMLGK